MFISHLHEDDNDLPTMKTLLRNSGFEVRDLSINSTRPNSPSEVADWIVDFRFLDHRRTP